MSVRGYLNSTREGDLSEEIGFSNFSVIFRMTFLLIYFILSLLEPSKCQHTFKITFIKIALFEV